MNAYRFSIPLTEAITLKGQQHNVREGVLLERDGQWSEASPLPGFSNESIDDVIAALRGERPAPLSLRFAIAALDEPLKPSLQVPWNYLLLDGSERLCNAIEDCIAAECRAAKLKVGRHDLQSDIELVKDIRRLLPTHVSLRLDANQAWSFNQAKSFVESTADIDIEYIEEPLQDSDRLEELFSTTGISYALDETLLGNSSLESWPNAAALVCKPTILGGREVVARLADTGKRVVFSAAFESGVGIARIVQLAAEFSPEIPAGLDTLAWLSDDLLVRSPQRQQGMFVLPEQLSVDTKTLERIEL